MDRGFSHELAYVFKASRFIAQWAQLTALGFLKGSSEDMLAMAACKAKDLRKVESHQG